MERRTENSRFAPFGGGIERPRSVRGVNIDHALSQLFGDPSAPAAAVADAAFLDTRDARARAELERLHADIGAHTSARMPWLRAWQDAYPGWRSWTLVLRDDAGELRAAAALARRLHAGLMQIRCLGHTGLDRAPIVSRTPADGADLAEALAAAVRRIRRPWTLWLRQLPTDDAVAARLVRALPTVEHRDDAARPIVVLDGTPHPHSVLSRNLRQAEAKARNRIARAGVAFHLGWIDDRRAIALRLPEVRAVHLARDLQLRGTSKLDDPQEGAYYDALLRRHLDDLELLELRLDGVLAAYVLWICNGATRLVLDNRVAPHATHYSAGLIANNAALRTAATDPRIDVLDWGAGVQRYKLQSANAVIQHCQLFAWSSRRLRYALAARRRGGSQLVGARRLVAAAART